MKMYSILAGAVIAGVLLAAGYSVKTAAAEEGKTLRHVVLFKFKDTAKPEEVAKVEQAFAELPNKIDVIQGYEWGTDVSPEKLSQGFTHCFFLTFKNAADRDAYLIHPAHKEFGSILHPHLDKVLVVDYFVK